MKDKDKFLTTTAVATALFVSPWAVVCSAAAYVTWKFMDAEKARKEQIEGEDEVESEEYMDDEEEEPIDLTNKVKEPHNDAPLSDSLTDDEIADMFQP